ncbi:MAG: nuclear transport factor 2 family protein [Defluviitaleaceae bacterium]|nr:nuclear transport factor 2 family protein [Defluviitaleaceae bacterium]
MIHEALEKYINATNTHDFAQVEECLHENAVYYFSSKTCTSIPEIKEYFENVWSLISEEKYWATDISYLFQSPTTLVCTYRYNFSGYMNGKDISGGGRATNVFARDNEHAPWKLIHEHLSPMPK